MRRTHFSMMPRQARFRERRMVSEPFERNLAGRYLQDRIAAAQ
jgi:hypothetical protein